MKLTFAILPFLLLLACGADPEVSGDTYAEEYILPVEEQRKITFGIGCDSDTGECTQTWIDPDIDAHWGDPNWEIVDKQAACQGNQGQCFPCTGGVGCYSLPDNDIHTWCSFDQPFTTNLVHLNWGVENTIKHLDATNSVLPSGYDLQYRGPHPTFQPLLCSGLRTNAGVVGWAPVDPFTYPTHVDLIFAKRPLLTAADLAVTCTGLPACPGPSCSNSQGNTRWLGCGTGLVAAQGDTWHNGYVTSSYNRFAGWRMFFDHDAIVAWNARPDFDPQNTVNDNTGIEYLYADLTCWLTGYSLGLKNHNDTAATRQACNSYGLRTVSNLRQEWQWDDAMELRNTYQAVTWPDGVTDPAYTYGPPRHHFEL